MASGLATGVFAAGEALAAGAPGADESLAIARHAADLSSQLRAMSNALFPPHAAKTLRRFSSGEAARWIGVSDSRLRQLALARDRSRRRVRAAAGFTRCRKSTP
jgi:RNase P protein component